MSQGALKYSASPHLRCTLVQGLTHIIVGKQGMVAPVRAAVTKESKGIKVGKGGIQVQCVRWAGKLTFRSDLWVLWGHTVV